MIKYMPYIVRSAWRNKVRSTLTVLGVAVAVFIVTFLAAVRESRTKAVEAASQTTLVTTQEKIT
jgi:hypothetical protein